MHGKGHGAEGQGHQKAKVSGCAHKDPPGRPEDWPLIGAARGRRPTGLLLPEGHQVEQQAHKGRGLNHLNETELGEVLEKHTEDQGRDQHAHQQHGVHEGDHARPLLFGDEVGGKCQACGLNRLHAQAHQQECEGRAGRANPGRPMGVTREQDEREGHDGQATKLQQAAHPDVRHAPPANGRAMGVGSKAHQGPEGGHQHWQGHHAGHQPGGHAEFHNEHSVERAHQERRGQAHRHLKERQAQQLEEWQVCTGEVCKRKVARVDLRPLAG